MGLLNDIRFYLMAALAVLFLIIVAMCSSAYDGSTDGHADSGVKNSQDASTSAESGATAEVDKVAAEVEESKVENVAVEAKEVEEVVAKEVETAAVEETQAEVQAVELQLLRQKRRQKLLRQTSNLQLDQRLISSSLRHSQTPVKPFQILITILVF